MNCAEVHCGKVWYGVMGVRCTVVRGGVVRCTVVRVGVVRCTEERCTVIRLVW